MGVAIHSATSAANTGAPPPRPSPTGGEGAIKALPTCGGGLGGGAGLKSLRDGCQNPLAYPGQSRRDFGSAPVLSESPFNALAIGRRHAPIPLDSRARSAVAIADRPSKESEPSGAAGCLQPVLHWRPPSRAPKTEPVAPSSAFSKTRAQKLGSNRSLAGPSNRRRQTNPMAIRKRQGDCSDDVSAGRECDGKREGRDG